MEEVMALLADNAPLVIGLVLGMVLVGLRKLAAKTENEIDDKGVELLEKNKEGIVAKLAALVAKWLKPKKEEKK